MLRLFGFDQTLIKTKVPSSIVERGNSVPAAGFYLEAVREMLRDCELLHEVRVDA